VTQTNELTARIHVLHSPLFEHRRQSGGELVGLSIGDPINESLLPSHAQITLARYAHHAAHQLRL
jgi:hypothetical protein